jgi:hypothetical protein
VISGIHSQGDVFPSKWLFHGVKYPLDYVGFFGKNFIPTIPIEINPIACNISSDIEFFDDI